MDRFRPNLPLDPFATMEPHFGRAAWVLEAEHLAPSTSTPRDVVLVVGGEQTTPCGQDGACMRY